MLWKYAAYLQGGHHVEVWFSIKLLSNFIEITLRHGCSPVNLLHFFKTLLHKNTYRGLLLHSPLANFYVSGTLLLNGLLLDDSLNFEMLFWVLQTHSLNGLRIYLTPNCLMNLTSPKLTHIKIQIVFKKG